MKSTHIGTAQTRFLRFQNLSYPTMVFQVVIEFLNVPGSQLVQFDVSDVWNDVTVDESPVIRCRGRADIGFGV